MSESKGICGYGGIEVRHEQRESRARLSHRFRNCSPLSIRRWHGLEPSGGATPSNQVAGNIVLVVGAFLIVLGLGLVLWRIETVDYEPDLNVP